MTRHPERTHPAVAIVVVLGVLTSSVLSAIVAARALIWAASWWFDTTGALGVLILGIVIAVLVWLVTWEKP